MRLIITGGAGFIGSAVVRNAIYANHEVLTIDKLTYAGRHQALADVIDSPRHHFIQADIADDRAMDAAFRDFDPDAVLHLAAESHVDRSIDGPGEFLHTNVCGTFILLEIALRHWSRLRGPRRERFRFVHVSTDEVFGALGETGIFGADSRYAPNSPYAASKAAADHFTRAWHRTFGLPAIVTNCSNNYGPRQHAEKLIPTIIRHALAGTLIPIYGTGHNTRDWLYVEDHAHGLMATLNRGRPGETYLFGGRCEFANLDLARAVCAELDRCRAREDNRSHADLITFVADRPGHDFRYAVDPARSEAELGWRAAQTIETGLALTVDWYLANHDWLQSPQELGRIGLGADPVGMAGQP